MSDYYDENDGAPDCRLCGDEGYVNGHYCDHRDPRTRAEESPRYNAQGQMLAKNWDYTAGMSIDDPRHPRFLPAKPAEPAIGDRYEDAPF